MRQHLPKFTAFVLLLMVAAVTTYWVLVFTSRREIAEPLVPVPMTNATARSLPADTSAIARLFGSQAATPNSDIRVVGIISEGTKGKGVAVIANQGAAAVAVRAGEDIAPDLVLSEVHADGVVVVRGGVEQVVPLSFPSVGSEGIIYGR